MKHFYECVCIIFILPVSVWSNLERQLELIRLINSNPNSTWVAGYNGVSDELASNSTNTNHTEHQSNAKHKKWPQFFNLLFHGLPDSFDARNKWSIRCPTVKTVYNSGKCKCGWATAIAAVVSDRQCISSNFRIKYPLSAHYLMSCCRECCSCNGGNVQLGWEFVKQKGLFSGGEYRSNTGCQPFVMPPCQKTYECSSKNLKLPLCVENKCIRHDIKTSGSKTIIVGSDTKTKIEGYYSFSRENTEKIMRDLRDNGPIQVSMHMYEDFRLYTKGIVVVYYEILFKLYDRKAIPNNIIWANTGLYTHIHGDFICDHGVKLIGWGVESGSKYWLLLNSFGVLWGEKGLFKIAMDLTDDTEYGYAIVAPKMYKNIAHTTLSCIFLICIMQIFRYCY